MLKVVGGDQACYKVSRTWYMADWCGGQSAGDNWWEDRSLVPDSFNEHIILRDTIEPVSVISGPVADGETIETQGSCSYYGEHVIIGFAAPLT